MIAYEKCGIDKARFWVLSIESYFCLTPAMRGTIQKNRFEPMMEAGFQTGRRLAGTARTGRE